MEKVKKFLCVNDPKLLTSCLNPVENSEEFHEINIFHQICIIETKALKKSFTISKKDVFHLQCCKNSGGDKK